MKILVDGQSLQTDSRVRGIGRYTEGLISGLCANGAEVVVLFNGAYEPRCTEAIRRLAKVVPEAKTEVFFAIGNYNSLNIGELDYFLSRQLYQEAVNRICPDVFLCASVIESMQMFICPPLENISKQYPTVAINYDLIPLENTNAYLPTPEIRRSYFANLQTLLSSDLVLCISRHAERQLLDICPNIKTAVIWGASFSETVRNVKKGNYIFYCGGLDGRKNVDLLCRAYTKLPFANRAKHPLYICCRKNTEQARGLQKYIRSLGMHRRIVLVEADNDEELARLYAECFLFVFPSKSEGLGLPLIEALTYCAPILSSNATSLPEIIENQESWFSPYDENQLVGKLSRALTDRQYLTQLQKYSKDNQYKYTWDKVGRHCLDELSKLVSAKPRIRSVKNSNLTFMTLQESMSHDYRLAEIQQSKCTLYFDISEYFRTKAKTGIQRVVGKFIQFLPESMAQYNFDIVFITGTVSRGAYHAVEYMDGDWVVLDDVHPVRGDWYMAVDLTADIVLQQASLINSWKSRGVKLFFYVYDLSFIDYPQYTVHQGFVDLLTRWLCFVVSTADCIMSDSQYVTNRVIRWAKEENIDVSKTHFINHHLGTDFNLKNPVRSHNKSNEFQFICVSTIEPRKGYMSLLSSFTKALDRGMKAKLVVVGRPGWKSDDVVDLLTKSPYAGKSIIWENDCSDERLRDLYNTSDCYVFASHDEGFGLGIIEAAQFGLPLMLRDIPVFHEIAGDHALYFSEDNLAGLLYEVASGHKKLPCVTDMKVLTWKESVQQLASKFIHLAETDFFSFMKDPARSSCVESVVELIASKDCRVVVSHQLENNTPTLRWLIGLLKLKLLRTNKMPR